MADRVAELETYFTANLKEIDAAEKKVTDLGKKVESKPIEARVTADSSDALANLDKVQEAAKRLVSRETVARIDADISKAETSTARIEKNLEYLRSVETVMDVDADVKRAEAQLQRVSRQAEKLREARTQVEVDVNTAPFEAGVGGVEGRLRKLVSEDTVVRVEAEITRAESDLAKVQSDLDYLRTVSGEIPVDADIRRAETKLQTITSKLDGLRASRSEIDVDANVEGALADLGRVEASVRRVPEDVLVRVDAQIGSAEAEVEALRKDVQYLDALSVRVDVDASIGDARSKLDAAEKLLNDLKGARAVMEVDADTSKAEGAMRGLATSSPTVRGVRGEKAGEIAGAGVEDTLLSALAAIPVAGGIILAGVAIGKGLSGALQDGLQVEVRQDRLQALTGVSEADAARLGLAAGEAYGNGFGDSIEANMNTTRIALQSGLIDEDAVASEASKVIEHLSGIADVLEEDVAPVTVAVTQMLRTGLASSAEEAFDILATGAREGVNAQGDLLDAFTEYPALFARLGLTGEEALGLISQGLEGGARNADLVADALKELQIRSTDASESSAEGYRLIGLNAEEMTAKMAAGGASAREGLDQILDGLRGIEDPVARNAAGVALLGTQWEDMGDAINSLDLSTAVEQLDGVAGSAQAMFDIMANNDAAKIEGMFRSLESVTTGLQGTIASAIVDPLTEFADWVNVNHGPVTQFFVDVGEGAFDMALAILEGSASGLEGFGELAGGIANFAADIIESAVGIAVAIDEITPGDQQSADFVEWGSSAVTALRGVDDAANLAAGVIRDQMIPGVQAAKDKFSEFGQSAVDVALLHDAALRTADAVSGVAVAADGTVLSMDGLDAANLRSSDSGRILESQIRNAVGALGEELAAAGRSGEGQEALKGRYEQTTGALVGQMVQMGLTEGEAQTLIDTILRTPDEASTAYSSNAVEEGSRVLTLASQILATPDKQFTVSSQDFPGLAASISALGGDIRNIPEGQVRVRQDDGSFWSVEESLNWVSRDRSSTVYTYHVDVNGYTVVQGAGGRFASGGPVYGPGSGTSDSIPARLSNDEHVITAAEVAGAGGHGEIFRLRRAMREGKLKDLLPGFADGGAVRIDVGSLPMPWSEPSVVPTAAAPMSSSSGVSARQIAAALREALNGARLQLDDVGFGTVIADQTDRQITSAVRRLVPRR